MTDVVGRGVIELSADSSKLKAGVSEAKSSLQTLRDAAKDAGETLTKQGETYLRSLERQATALERQSANFGKSKADIAAYDAAQKGVAQTASAFVDRVRAAEDSLEQQAKAAKDAAAALRAQAEAAREAEAANARIVEGQKNFLTGLQLQAQSIGKTNAELLELKAARLGVTAEAAPLIAALKAEEQGLGKVGLSAKQTALQHQIAAVQVKDFIEQVIAGGSPIRAFAQQGTAVVSTYGGVGATFRALAGVFSPLILGAAGAAAAFVALAAAAALGNAEQKKLHESLRLTGNFAGQTEDSIKALNQTLASAPGQTVGAAKEITQALISTGRFGPDALGSVARAALAMSRATGQSRDEVVKQFASMTDNVVKWAEESNKQFHFLTLAQYEHIRALQAQGREQRAAAEAADLLATHLDKVKAPLGLIEQAWDGIKKKSSEAWAAMLNLGKSETVGDRLKDVESAITETERRLGVQQSKGENNAPQVAALQARLQALRATREAIAAESAQIGQLAAEDAGKQVIDEKAIYHASVQYQQARTANELAGVRDRLAIREQERVETGIKIQRMYEQGELTAAHFIELEYNMRRTALNDQLKLIDAEAQAARKVPVASEQETIERESRVTEILTRRRKVMEDMARLVDAQAHGDIHPDMRSFEPPTPREEFMRFERAPGQEKIIADEMRSREEAHKAFMDQLKSQNVAVDAEIEKLNAERATIGLSSIERDKAVAVARLQATAEKDLIGHENERAAITAQLQDNTERLTAAMQANYEATRAFEAGVQIAFSRYREEAANSSKFAQDVIGGGLSRLEDALVEFSKTGKLHLGSLFQFMADEFLRNIIKMKIAAATQTSQAGGSLFDIIGSFFGSGSASSGAGGYASVAGISGGRASGGPVEAGSNYIVGENGPEILRMGKQGGHIIPNRASMGGPVVNIINNSGADVSTRTDDSGALEILLERAAEEGANRGHARAVADLVGGGRGGRALQSTYGLSRAAGIAKRA